MKGKASIVSIDPYRSNPESPTTSSHTTSCKPATPIQCDENHQPAAQTTHQPRADLRDLGVHLPRKRRRGRGRGVLEAAEARSLCDGGGFGFGFGLWMCRARCARVPGLTWTGSRLDPDLDPTIYSGTTHMLTSSAQATARAAARRRALRESCMVMAGWGGWLELVLCRWMMMRWVSTGVGDAGTDV